MNKIYILTGGVHSGKTTKLSEWISNRNDVAGILSPLENGRRILIDIKSGEHHPFEVSNENIYHAEVIEIGRFRFYPTAFNWGNKKIISSINFGTNWLVIDEFGHLELKNEGFFPSVSLLLNKMKKNTAPNSIIVIRDYLVEKFIHEYQLIDSQFTIICKEALNDLK